jgi:hypothetical protein
VCVCVCEREKGEIVGVHAWVELVCSGQENIVSLRVGSECKIILAIKNQSYIHLEKDM